MSCSEGLDFRKKGCASVACAVWCTFHLEGNTPFFSIAPATVAPKRIIKVENFRLKHANKKGRAVTDEPIA